MLQLNGGAIFRESEVGKGPLFNISSVFEIGMNGTPFYQIYLKNILGSLKERVGFTKFPLSLVVYTGLGFLSLPETA